MLLQASLPQMLTDIAMASQLEAAPRSLVAIPHVSDKSASCTLEDQGHYPDPAGSGYSVLGLQLKLDAVIERNAKL